jgi:hypothetical protein
MGSRPVYETATWSPRSACRHVARGRASAAGRVTDQPRRLTVLGCPYLPPDPAGRAAVRFSPNVAACALAIRSET